MTQLLLVEDNAHKRERILSFIRDNFAQFAVTEAQSFTSGCQRIQESLFNIAILDVSLPTYDKGPTESGGRFRTFGGRELARKILRRGLPTKIIFLTQYESFSDDVRSMSLAALSEELFRDCKENVVACIHYDSSKSVWKDQLMSTLKSYADLNS